MAKKYTIGYVYSESDKCPDDKILIKLLKKKFNLLLFSLEEQAEEKQIKEQAEQCKLIFNDAVYEPLVWDAIELSKTFEEFGIKVINPSQSLYYQEDKWIFYLECLKNKIPTPLTYLIHKRFIPAPLNLLIRKKLIYDKKKIKKILTESPVVIKAIFSDKGLCVERAKTLKEFDDKLRKIANKAPTSPVIVQKYIDHGNISYKVMLIGNEVVQSVVIKGKSWEQTGLRENETYRTFKPDKKLKELCERASKAFGLKWCSLDLIKENDNWYLIEVNGCPGIDFINSDIERIGKILVNYLYKEVKKTSK